MVHSHVEVLVPPCPASELRARYYNATLVEVREVHAGLRVLRVVPDGPLAEFVPGQYLSLGLGDWEPCVGEGLPVAGNPPRVIQRAYSLSCPLLDQAGRLVDPGRLPYWEFYIVLVPGGPHHVPGLTPRLFHLRPGDRLLAGARAKGSYTLGCLEPSDTIVFASTGTGEAPHNCMLAELLTRGHAGRILALCSVREARDLAYRAAHEELMRRFSGYRYLPLTTREPENLDPAHPHYVGKQYVQDMFLRGTAAALLGGTLDPERTHVYLCGNPAMLGLPRKGTAGERVYPQPPGMAEVLSNCGFRLDEPGRRGNIHFEKYW